MLGGDEFVRLGVLGTAVAVVPVLQTDDQSGGLIVVQLRRTGAGLGHGLGDQPVDGRHLPPLAVRLGQTLDQPAHFPLQGMALRIGER